MDNKIITYLVLIIAVILLIYGFYSMFDYKYQNMEEQMTVPDLITMYYPSSSEFTVFGDAVEFRNSYYDIYNLDVTKLNSSDARVTNLLNHFSNFNRGTIDYKNESCYLITIEFKDNDGFKYHSMIVPYDSFDKDSLSFNKDTHVYLFDGNNREFVVDSAFNSQVAL